MGLSINSNIPALTARRQTNETFGLLGRNTNQLATGLRINRAADDAAGLAIAELFTSQIRQGQVEVRNIQDGVSLAQTAEGGLDVQTDAVQRMRELALQASNGTLSDDNRAALNAEYQQLQEQIDTVAQDTEFNGQALLDQDQTIDLGTQGSAAVELRESTTASLNLDTTDISTQAGAAAAVEAADAALTDINDNRASLGAQSNRFESAINTRETALISNEQSRSAIRDLDVAKAMIERTRNEVLLQGGMSALIQANVTPQSALSLLGG